MCKERPILFNGDMVRALLDGRKTQTRRVVKPAPEMVTDTTISPWDGDPAALLRLLERNKRGCPYGQPGDRLWVRETTEIDEDSHDMVVLSMYVADKKPVLYSGCENAEFNGTVAHWNYPRPVRPSIHMPRWASRITLEIVSVRVERLCAISNDDAICEGIGAPLDQRYAAIDGFKPLWESINGPDSWDANPWVWVVEFKRVEVA